MSWFEQDLKLPFFDITVTDTDSEYNPYDYLIEEEEEEVLLIPVGNSNSTVIEEK